MRNFTFEIVHPFVCPKLLIADVDKGAKLYDQATEQEAR